MIAAVGVVAIPSGVVASGFADIVDSKNRHPEKSRDKVAGDDWFDIKYRALKGSRPPNSKFGPTVDYWQYAVKDYLDGTIDEKTGHHSRTLFSAIGRGFFFLLIVSNVLAVILESVPEIDRGVGNQKGNFFDVFEAWSVFFFSIGKPQMMKYYSMGCSTHVSRLLLLPHTKIISYDSSQRKKVERLFTPLGFMLLHSSVLLTF